MWIAICLSILGLALIFLEFFLPGGLIAIIGGALVLGGVGFFSTLEAALLYKILYGLATALGTFGCCRWALWIIKSKKRDALYLGADQEGYVASTFEEMLIGKSGHALSDLKPSGHIEIDGKRFPASSEGTYIKKGASITVLAGRGSHYIVKDIVKEK